MLARIGLSASGVVGSSKGKCVIMYRVHYDPSGIPGVALANEWAACDGNSSMGGGTIVGTDPVSISVVESPDEDIV